jgi:hypothetical protein
MFVVEVRGWYYQMQSKQRWCVLEPSIFWEIVYYRVIVLYTYRGLSVGSSDFDRLGKLVTGNRSYIGIKKNKNQNRVWVVRIPLCVRNVPGSNHETGTEWDFLCYFSVPPNKHHCSTTHYAKTAPGPGLLISKDDWFDYHSKSCVWIETLRLISAPTTNKCLIKVIALHLFMYWSI